MFNIGESEDSSPSKNKPTLKKELDLLKNNLGVYIHSYLEDCQIDSSDAEKFGISKNIYKKIYSGKFDKMPVQNLLQYILLLDHEIELTIKPANKKKIKLYDLMPHTIKFKKSNGKK